MDVTVVFRKRPAEASEVLEHSTTVGGKEFRFNRDMESVLVRLGPYDNSDSIEIKQGEDGEVMVLVDDDNGIECVYSAQEEKP